MGESFIEEYDLSALEEKIKEKMYELIVKRKLLEDNRGLAANLESERHSLERRLEEYHREAAETKVQLEVAIKAARAGETERSANRELLARQGIQVEVANKERESLLEANRALQLENIELRLKVEETEAKLKARSHFYDIVKKKDSQTKTMLDLLTTEIRKLELNQDKLNEMCSAAAGISRTSIYHLIQHKSVLKTILTEKDMLQDKITLLTAKLEEKPDSPVILINNSENKNEVIHEWESAYGEMKSRLKIYQEEIENLQNSLESALSTIETLKTFVEVKDGSQKVIQENEENSCDKNNQKTIISDETLHTEEQDKKKTNDG